MTTHAMIAFLSLPFLLSTGNCDAIRTLKNESRGYKYQRPTQGELKIAERLFQHLLAGEGELTTAISLCQQIQLDLILVTREKEDFLIVMEIENARRGRGFYIFRRKRFKPVIIQVPHAYHDLHTDRIGRRLFWESEAVAAAWNTVSRSVVIAGEVGKSDLAHLESSYFQAFTVAFARLYPEGLVLQLHGFRKDRRSTVEGALADIIVSNGSRTPGRWLETAASCLDEKLAVSVTVYPRDVSELGGTTSAQARVLRSLKHEGFLHFEMGLEARRRLLRNEQDRRRLWQCFPERLR